MTDLVAHGIEVSMPSGWEGRLFRRPLAGEVASADANIEGAPAAPQETTNAVLHVSTIAIPPDVGDFASGAVDKLGANDVFIVLFEYDPSSAGTELFKSTGLPSSLAADRTLHDVGAEVVGGQAGVQRFFNDQGRAFCLYVVIGSFTRRKDLVKQVNEVLATLTIQPLGAASQSAPGTTTTTPPTTEAPTTTTAPSTTTAPTTSAPTTSPGGSGAGVP